jgi:hypothetical protein
MSCWLALPSKKGWGGNKLVVVFDMVHYTNVTRARSVALCFGSGATTLNITTFIILALDTECCAECRGVIMLSVVAPQI